MPDTLLDSGGTPVAPKDEPKPATKTATYTFIGPPEATICLEEGGQVYKPGDTLPISRAQAVSLAGEASLQIDGPDLPKQGEGQSAAFEASEMGRSLKR